MALIAYIASDIVLLCIQLFEVNIILIIIVDFIFIFLLQYCIF